MNNPAPYFYIPKWPVFFEDNHLLCLYKPAGLLIQGDRTKDVTLFALAKTWIKKRYEKPGEVFLGLVHRLDRPVAGVILFCRTSKAAGRISDQFRTGVSKKQYIAVVEGILHQKEGRLVNYIERHRTSGRIVDAPTGQSSQARLSFRVLDTHQAKSLVEIDLETGKHHQIRLQFAHMGFPVMGDLRYGTSGPMPGKQIALFARQLSVTHPTLHQTLTFQCPLPDGWPWPDTEISDSPPPWVWQEIEPQIMAMQ